VTIFKDFVVSLTHEKIVTDLGVNGAKKLGSGIYLGGGIYLCRRRRW